MSQENTHESGAYHGDPIVEVLERMRRIETRVTNVMRTTGLMPMAKAHDPQRGTATLQEDTIYVSSPDVAIGEITRVAVCAARQGLSTTFKIVLCNQPWGELVVRGEMY